MTGIVGQGPACRRPQQGWLALSGVERLLQRGIDGVELGAQIATDAVNCSDDSQRNTGRDQAGQQPP